MSTILQQIERTRFRLRRHRGKYRQISESAGLDYSWLHKFSQGVYSDPSAVRVSQLQDALDRIEAVTGNDSAPERAA